jgi:hypothetical protein
LLMLQTLTMMQCHEPVLALLLNPRTPWSLHSWLGISSGSFGISTLDKFIHIELLLSARVPMVGRSCPLLWNLVLVLSVPRQNSPRRLMGEKTALCQHLQSRHLCGLWLHGAEVVQQSGASAFSSRTQWRDMLLPHC